MEHAEAHVKHTISLSHNVMHLFGTEAGQYPTSQGVTVPLRRT